MHLLFDIEANGLLDSVSTIWCGVVKDLQTGKKWHFSPQQIPQMLELLSKATRLYGHFILGYDLPALEVVYGWKPPEDVVIVDTVVWSKAAYSDRERDDWNHPLVGVLNARGLVGSHSLEAWGLRLGELKGDYGKRQDAWDEYTFEMLLYCGQDVEVNERLIEHLRRCNVPSEALSMELKFAAISEQMSRNGFRFDTEKAVKLCEEIEAVKETVGQRLMTQFEPEIETGKKPRFYRVQWPDGTIEKFGTKGEADAERKSRGIKPKDVTIKRGPPNKTLVLFNPNSRSQVRQKLFEKYGWLSPELTDKGVELQAEKAISHNELAKDYGVINEDTLSALDYPESKDLITYMMCSKRLGQIRDGDNGWLKCVEADGRIRHRMDGIGCATFRCSHHNPNLGQVPSVQIGLDKHAVKGEKGGWGYECRELFIPAEGMIQVGVDMSGIEARLLAHFLKPYDGGAYIDQVLNGDIHSLNVDALSRYAGYEVGRNDFKSSFYGFLYGAGAAKMGLQLVSICEQAKSEYVDMLQRNMHGTIEIIDRSTRVKKRVAGSEYPAESARLAYSVLGSRVRKALEVGITGLGELMGSIKDAAARGYLTPMDGRRIPIRAQHAALNSLLQGSAAIIMKRWVINSIQAVKACNLIANLLAVIHDETQWESDPHTTDRLSEVCIESIKKAGRYYRLSIPLDGEAKIGHSWAECH